MFTTSQQMEIPFILNNRDYCVIFNLCNGECMIRSPYGYFTIVWTSDGFKKETIRSCNFCVQLPNNLEDTLSEASRAIREFVECCK